MTQTLPTQYQEYIHLSRYSRFLSTEKRRETWEETVDRYFDFFKNQHPETNSFGSNVINWDNLRNSMLSLDVVGSMRVLMTAGEALARENVAGYNCSYAAINNKRTFSEVLYILMCGTGVGFTAEAKDVEKLPTVPESLDDASELLIYVGDSKEGWAKAYQELIDGLYRGKIHGWYVSDVRPAGEPLKTFGGRASGPEPLVELFRFTVETFKNAQGRKLKPIEVHDIVCKIAEIVVVGGVRRSALIGLSDLSDTELANAKSGAWWEDNPQRALANNSAVYESKPSAEVFLKEWLSLVESKSGERGVFSRDAAKKISKKNGRNSDYDFGTNPCSEIILRDKQFCNLTEVIARPDDNEETLLEKVRQATILGTLQSTLINFNYLSEFWQYNTIEERLLGVSITGIMDNPLLNGSGDKNALKKLLEKLRDEAIATNREYAEILGIPRSAAITCVKPSGTVSQLSDSASGIHARHNPYYIRTVRGDNKDPLTKLMIDQGFPHEPDVMKPDSTTVFSFPIKSDDNAIFRDDRTAIEQLELWKIYQLHWCQHKPSVTISVKDEEWLEVGNWCYNNFDILSGVSFLPFSEHTYQQAPYQDCTKEEYEALLEKIPTADWSKLSEYENTDMTEGAQTLACTAGNCEI